MSDKFKYKRIQIEIPGKIHIEPKISVLYEAVPEIWREKF